MKFRAMLSAMAMVMTGWAGAYAQVADAEVPGDHFSLEGALELFKKSSSPEDFERLLNDADSKVNNLDLNADGYIDYIRVFNRQDGNVHIFVLQAVVGQEEGQDIAVIELEKKADGKAVLQIVGDPDIYGIETIIEPTSEVRTYAGTRSEPVVVNVWTWPVVRYVYSPHYVVYHSPWGWHHRPVWWRPWRPVVYVDYYSYWQPYYVHYSFCHTRRVHYAYNIYRPYRTTSVVVVNKYRPQVERYRTRYADGHPRRESRSTSGYADRDNNGRSSSRGDGYNNSSSDSRTGRSGTRSAEDRGTRSDVEGRTTERPTLINSETRTPVRESSGMRSGSDDTNTIRRSEASSSPGGNNTPAPQRQRSEVRSGNESQRQVVTGTRPSTPAAAPSRSTERREQPAARPAPSRSADRPTVTPAPSHSRPSGNSNRTTVAPSRQSTPSVSPSRQSSPSRQTVSPGRSSSPGKPAGSRSRSGNN